MTESPLVDSGFVVPVFSPGDDPIACLNKAMAFLTVGHVQGRQGQSYSGTGYKNNATSSGGKNVSGQAKVLKCYNCKGEGHMARQCTQPKRPRNAAWYKDKAMLVEAQEAGQILDKEQLAFLADPGTKDLDTYDSDCDDISNAKAVLVANISNYGSDVISEAQQDSMILSVIEQMSEQMINHVNNWEKANKEHESVSAELERYKERVKTFEQRLNIDLSSREKMSDSQMDDMIKEKLALKEQVDSLEQNNLIANETLSAELERYKERVKLLEERQNVDLGKGIVNKTFNVFKNESKEKEAKNIDTKIALEKKVKELDNIVCKMGQSAQTVHILTKPQVFYDNNLKQALGFKNPFYLKKAQQIRPMLYDSNVIAKETNVISIADSEETLMLEEESRSKMLLKQSDPMVLEKKVNTKLIDYAKLNRLSKDFGKRFIPQRELSNEQALQPIIDQFASLPVKIKAPRELPKVRIMQISQENGQKPDKTEHKTEKSARDRKECTKAWDLIARRCMRTRNSYFLNNSNVTISRRRNKGRAPNIVKPELRTIVAPMAERTMEELLRAPTEGYGEAIVLLEINADH
ncbi:integrase, catalytic region, zinc finger, CCHC-type containing protein [Tanacetum coccineum]